MRDASFAPPRTAWWSRENLALGIALLVVTVLAWAYTLQVGAGHGMTMPPMMEGMTMPAVTLPAEPFLFLFGWTVMMVAMMLPAALPLVLLYRGTARNRMRPLAATLGIGALLAGYFVVWSVAGLPVYGYNRLANMGAPAMAVLPGMLLLTGGVYQFTTLKASCHSRCSSPLFFLARQWRPGVPGAARLGVLHGVDCLGCCAGLMLALVALGMMNVAWMLTAAVLIFVEKTLPGGHRLARPLGVVLMIGGLFVLATSLVSTGVGQ